MKIPRDVSGAHRGNHHLAHAGHPKNTFDDDRAADDERKLRSEDGDHGDEGVFQRMP